MTCNSLSYKNNVETRYLLRFLNRVFNFSDNNRTNYLIPLIDSY